MFLSCPHKVESLATPLKKCLIKSNVLKNKQTNKLFYFNSQQQFWNKDIK